MSYWEDRYIDYLGEQDGQLGGDAWRDDFNPRVSLERHLNMAEIWKPLERSIYQDWVDSILEEASDDLNEWESNFIESVNNQLKYNDLSQKQAEILERIYSEKTK
jgi:hypothetical protein